MDSFLPSKIQTLKAWLDTGSINIFGPQFSGKDTHGGELARMFGTRLIGGGDILRSSAPKHIQDHIGAGNLAPTTEYLSIVLPYLEREEFDGKPLILSTVGRWHGEEQSVYDAAESAGHPIKAVIFLSITLDEVYKRWRLNTRGRQDDMSQDALDKRLAEFHDKTLPVIDFYREKGLVIDIDGMPSKADVTADIIEELFQFATRTALAHS